MAEGKSDNDDGSNNEYEAGSINDDDNDNRDGFHVDDNDDDDDDDDDDDESKIRQGCADLCGSVTQFKLDQHITIIKTPSNIIKIYRVLFSLGLPLKFISTEKLI